MKVLKKWNEARKAIHQFWDQYNKEGVLTYEALERGLLAINPNITQDDIQ